MCMHAHLSLDTGTNHAHKHARNANKQLLFLDEATSALDAESEAHLLGHVLASRRQATGMAIVATGHGARLAAFFDRVIEMGDGGASEDGVV